MAGGAEDGEDARRCAAAQDCEKAKAGEETGDSGD